MEVVEWARRQVASTLYSCLATHALLKHKHGIDRRPLPAKRWGVFPHRVIRGAHPLVNDVNTQFDVPHSRFNDISAEQFREAGLHVLVEKNQALRADGTAQQGLGMLNRTLESVARVAGHDHLRHRLSRERTAPQPFLRLLQPLRHGNRRACPGGPGLGLW